MGTEEVVNIDGTRGSYDQFFENVKSSFVVPARSTQHPERLNPSHLDHLHMDRYVPVLFCYQLTDITDATYRSFVDRVKSSLAETLVAFYPMAGRVLKTTDPDHPRQLLLNDVGVPFTEAALDSKMAPFLRLEHDFRPIAYLSGFEPAGLDGFRQIQEYLPEGNPAFFVQITRFTCGGVVLALTWNHILADMTAAVSFFTAWSDTARTGSTSIVPEHDRSILSTPHPPPSSSNGSNGAPSPSPAAAAAAEGGDAEAAKIQRVLKAQYTVRALHIRKEPMDIAIARAKSENAELSRMDCVCAHLWRSLSRAYARLGISDTTVFTTAVEGRGRMAVSPLYFGNVVASASVAGVPASAILAAPLSHAAGLIRGAIRGVTRDTYWAIIEQMDLRNPWRTSINRTDHQMGVASWVRFGLHAVDFGFGAPAHVGVNLPAQNSRKGQTVVLPSARGDGHYVVMLFQTPDVLEALWADPDFTSVC